MKKLIYISAFLLSGLVFGQDASVWDEVDSLLMAEGYDLTDTVDGEAIYSEILIRDLSKETYRGSDSFSLPEANKNVLSYVNSNLGKRIYSGICFDLVDASLKTVDKKWKDRSGSGYKYGKEISQNEIMPGDIITYSGVRYADGHTTSSHIAIIYAVGYGGPIKIAEQNYNCDSLKESKVVINTEDMSMVVKGKMRFYRPY